jgi:hypothetical protein
MGVVSIFLHDRERAACTIVPSNFRQLVIVRGFLIPL